MEEHDRQNKWCLLIETSKGILLLYNSSRRGILQQGEFWVSLRQPTHEPN